MHVVKPFLLLTGLLILFVPKGSYNDFMGVDIRQTLKGRVKNYMEWNFHEAVVISL